MELQEWAWVRKEKNYKNGRLNYARGNFEGLRKFFESIDWRGIMSGKTAQEKYKIFLWKHNEGVERYVPKYKLKKSKHTWYNARCPEAKRVKARTWRKLKKQKNKSNRERYNEARNEYVRIRREEEIAFKKDVVEKCGNEPKLFYKYINGKMKCTETIDKIVKGERTYQTAEGLNEDMNESFKTVFTEEGASIEPNMIGTGETQGGYGTKARCWQIVGESGCKKSNGTRWSVGLDTKGM